MRAVVLGIGPAQEAVAVESIGHGRGLHPRWGAPLVVLLATLLLAWGGFDRDAISRGDDIIFHSKAAHGFAESLSEGIPYPRWLDDVNRGYGAPVFIFYPPLGYYLLGGAELLLGDTFRALWLMPMLVSFMSGISFWLSFKRRLSPLAVAIGAALYVLLPYGVLDIFWRFAWGEIVAFVWLPPLFAATIELIEHPAWRSWFILLGAAVGLLLTHLTTALLLPFVLGPLAVFHLVRSRRWTGVASITSAALLAILCAAVFLLPLAVHMRDVHLEWTREEWFDWRRHILFRDETALGFEADPTKPAVTRAVTSTGWLGLGAVVVLGWSVASSRKCSFDGWAVAAIASWTIALQTPLALPFWEHVPGVAAVQFPWRFGIYQTLLTALLCAIAADTTTALPRRSRERALQLGLLCVAALPALAVSRDLLPDTPSFTREFMRGVEYEREAIREYIPRDVQGWKWLRRTQEFPPVAMSGGDYEVLEWRTHRRQILLRTPVAQRVIIRTFHFPGWKARLDGHDVPLHQAPGIALDVDAGQHLLELDFVPTPDRTWGAGLSLLGVSIVLGLTFFARRRTSPRSGEQPGDATS